MTPIGWDSYEALVAAAGTPAMDQAVFAAVNRVLPVDEVFVCDRPDGAPPVAILAAGTQRNVAARVAGYSGRFHRLDPANRALAVDRGFAVRRVAAAEIADRDYRAQCWDEPRFVEKLAIGRRHPAGWCVVNLYRRRATGRFGDADVTRLAAVGRLLLPLLRKHAGLAGVVPEPLAGLERRLAALAAGLTPRELAVCARTAAGQTAEAIALDLGIRPTSVVTYRRRAYGRLGITSGYQLLGRLLGLSASGAG